MSEGVHEPTPPSCLRGKSLVFAPTTGMRVAAQVLILELFRELGYGDSRTRERVPPKDFNDIIDTNALSGGERILLSACRGRRRRDRQRGGDYYTPAYISLTKNVWLRKQSDRVVYHYFLGGPLAHQESRGKISNPDKMTIVSSLLGSLTASGPEEYEGKEILSLLAEGRKDPPCEEIHNHLEAALGKPASAPLQGHEDPMAETITSDFIEICDVEQSIPRREWLFLLLAFLRVSVSMWLLAHLRITLLVHNWLLDACASNDNPLPTPEEMQSSISARNQGILHPTATPTREVFELVESYARARVEVALLVERVDKECNGRLQGKVLTLDSAGSHKVTLDDLLILCRDVDWKVVTGGAPVHQWLTREAEPWTAWRSPRKAVGKRILECLRVLDHFPDDDSGSSLLHRLPNTTTAKIVPGHRLLQLFSFLANRRKAREPTGVGQGKLVLRDIEDHMYLYGIDFKSSSFGRPLLVEKLTEAGLLRGSPDAGGSAEVLNVIAPGVGR